MRALNIELINPKAMALLMDLQEKHLIIIHDSSNSFDSFLLDMRKKANMVPSIEEIAVEVDSVRSARYEE